MQTRFPIALMTGAMLSLALAGGCSRTGDSAKSDSASPSATSTGAPAGGGKTALAFVTNNPSDYWTICRKGVDKAQQELTDVSVQFRMPSPGTVAAQRSNVDDLLAKGVKGIAISPVDPANETTYLNDVASRASLITSDSDAPNSNRLCYIGTDNHAAGVMAGGLIKEAIPRGGKIMIFVGKADAQNAKDRIQGIRDALKGSPGFKILDVRTDDADHARAKTNAADAMTRNPDLACLVGIWSYNGPAIVSAVQDAGKAGKIKIVAFDQEKGTLDGIRSGAVYGTVVQDPYQFGYRSIKVLAQVVKGDKSAIPANKLIIVPTQAIKKGTLAKYEADEAKKLGGG